MSSEPAYLQQIDARQAQIQAHQPWDQATRRKIERKLRLDWNYHSQSIEGGTLTARETRTIMLGSVDVQGKPLKDVLEMQRHDELIQEIMQMGRGEKRLSESRIKAIHAAIMYEEPDTTLRQQIGRWKTTDNEIINPKGEKFGFTPVGEVPDAIHALLNRCNANWDRLERGATDARHPALMAFDVHLDFLTIHPFYDGNGRTARILLNLILIAFGYPPVIVKTSDKDRYNRLLAEIQGYGASRDLYHEFMAGLLLRSQELVLSALRGEEIEEEDDLSKEIGMFVKAEETKAGKHKAMTYSPELVRQIAFGKLLPLFEKHHQNTGNLNKLFATRDGELSFNRASNFDWLGYNNKVKMISQFSRFIPGMESKKMKPVDGKFSVEEAMQALEGDVKIQEITLKTTFGTYQFLPKYPFSVEHIIACLFWDHQVSLQHITYPISDGLTLERQKELSINRWLYHEPYTIFQARDLVGEQLSKEITKALFEAIKAIKEELDHD
jgi:Fic family protein